MATVINNPPSEEHTVIERSDSSAGWAVAVIILIALIAVGAYLWLRNRGAPAPVQNNTPGATIEVNVPVPGGTTEGGGGGNSGTP